jgi:hypothetical protein
MKFGKIHKQKFGTITGAYSRVTEREEDDSQITVTDYEAEILVSYFGRDGIQVGNVKTNKELAAKQFKLYPGGEIISLNVVYPKPKKTELRLYLSSKAGFKPQATQIWFIFTDNISIWIGAMDEDEWRYEFAEIKQDEYDYIYQKIVNDAQEQEKNIRTYKQKERDRYLKG